MSVVERRLGLTPVLQRLAFYYLQKGLGSHVVEHPFDQFYDEVVVRELYAWHSPNDEKVPPQGGIVVEFMSEGARVRWVEFGCHFIGGGGTPVLREV